MSSQDSLTVLREALLGDAGDWAIYSHGTRMAWAIIVGWSPEQMQELAKIHDWSPEAVAEMESLRVGFEVLLRQARRVPPGARAFQQLLHQAQQGAGAKGAKGPVPSVESYPNVDKPVHFYTNAKVNVLLRQALAARWPDAGFKVRADRDNYGKPSSTVSYPYCAGSPDYKEVVELCHRYQGYSFGNADSWELALQPGTDAQGAPIFLHYNLYVIHVTPLTSAGGTYSFFNPRTHRRWPKPPTKTRLTGLDNQAKRNRKTRR